MKSIQNDETATPSEAGFYWKFQFDPETGFPSGCPGLDNAKKWKPGKGKLGINNFWILKNDFCFRNQSKGETKLWS